MSSAGEQPKPNNYRLDIEPRPWQRDALQAWRGAGHRGVVEVATGGGKTVFAELCALDALTEWPDATVVIVVPTIALLDQWYVALQEEIGAATDDIAVYGGGHGRPKPRRFNLATLNTARALPYGHWPTPTMLVVDECHRAGSPLNAAALRGTFVATVGLSATPERQYDAGFEEHVVPVLGPIIFSYSIINAERDGVLSPFELLNLKINLLPDEQEAYDRLTKRIARAFAVNDGDIPEVLLRERARISQRGLMRIPATLAVVDRWRGHRCLVFHEDIASANRIAELLRERKHSVAVYHTGIGDSTRRENLRLFRRGLFDVLVACRALDEGLNIPEVTVAVIAAATSSERQRIQRLGRVLRPMPGKSHATVVSLYATELEEQRLRDEAVRLQDTAQVSWGRMSRADASDTH
jgi:superfamily II DNA or RNA helicase